MVFEKLTEVAYAQPTIEYSMTEEESNAAIVLYGCDCPTCVNALRQLRGQQLTRNLIVVRVYSIYVNYCSSESHWFKSQAIS